MRPLRVLLAIAAALPLLGLALTFPTAHGRADSAVLQGRAPAKAPIARHPAWPLWAHNAAGLNVAAAEQEQPERSMNASEPAVKKLGGDPSGISNATAVPAAPPNRTARPLHLGVAELSGRAVLVPSPPPRFA